MYVHFVLVVSLPAALSSLPFPPPYYHLLANSLDVNPNSKVVLIGLVATINFCFPPPIFFPAPPFDIPA
jgi:hypothetical protein